MNGGETESRRYDVQGVKKWLSEYRETEHEIDNQIERLERLEAKMYGVGSPQLSDMPKAPGITGDRISGLIAQKEELEAEIRKTISEHSAMKDRIESLCKQLRKSDQRAVIRMRYLDGEKWVDITEMLFRNKEDYMERSDAYLRTVGNIHGRALLNIAKLLDMFEE